MRLRTTRETPGIGWSRRPPSTGVRRPVFGATRRLAANFWRTDRAGHPVGISSPERLSGRDLQGRVSIRHCELVICDSESREMRLWLTILVPHGESERLGSGNFPELASLVSRKKHSIYRRSSNETVPFGRWAAREGFLARLWAWKEVIRSPGSDGRRLRAGQVPNPLKIPPFGTGPESPPGGIQPVRFAPPTPPAGAAVARWPHGLTAVKVTPVASSLPEPDPRPPDPVRNFSKNLGKLYSRSGKGFSREIRPFPGRCVHEIANRRQAVDRGKVWG
jgi:hypothetical protein